MKEGELRFDSLRESRGWYFVDYDPPIAGNPFALIQLTILSDADAADFGRVASAMQGELACWLGRYEVPAMVSAFNATGDLICLESVKSSNHLVGRRKTDGRLNTVWGTFEKDELPPLITEVLRSIYHNIPFRTATEIRAKSEEHLKRTKSSIRLAIALLILWLVVIPVAVELIGFANPVIGIIVLLYSLWKAFVQLMKLLGKWPENRREKLQSDKKRLMEQYFWHCERNPEGFQRIKFENFDREERERTALETTPQKDL